MEATEEITTEQEARENVARGVAWLDTVQPDWVERVNLDLLNMNHSSKCVAGQALGHRAAHGTFDAGSHYAYDGYHVACILLGREGSYPEYHGFTENGWDRETHNAWVQLITERRSAVSA
jgi:hypothetical protein